MTALDSRYRISANGKAPTANPEPHSHTPDFPPVTPTIASGQVRAMHSGRRALGWLAFLMPPILAGYALFDRGFAYIHIPGTPIYAGEFLMLVSVVAALVATGYLHRGVEHSTVVKLIFLLAAWGLARTIPNLGTYGFDAVRDAALWYYALLAIPVCALVLSYPGLLERWSRAYRRFIPWLFVYSPLALFLAHAAGTGLGPKVPGSQVSIWDHKGANVSVQVTIALAFLWLIPGAGGRFRTLLTGFATVVLLIGATQGRSGFVAAVAGLGLVWLFSGGRGRLLPIMLATILLLVVVGWGFNVQIPGDQGRSISVEQLAQNVLSVTGGNSAQAPGNLSANVRFRDRLWSAVLNKVKTDKKILTGLGFGPNIAKELGFDGGGPVPLRSPHNSHLDIYARMGVIGLAIWIALWSVWCATALRARSRFRALGRRFETGLIEVSVVGVAAILINSYFDPTLESPQVAVWLWTLVGISLGLFAMARRATNAAHADQASLAFTAPR